MAADDERDMAELPIACSLNEPDRRAREQVLQREVFSAIREVRELPDGYALRFPGDGAWLGTLAEFVGFERDCCPFFTFVLHCEPRQGPLWLHLHGPEGVKAFVAGMLSSAPANIAP